MARPGQAEHRKRKRQAEQAAARAQSHGGSSRSNSTPRAGLPVQVQVQGSGPSFQGASNRMSMDGDGVGEEYMGVEYEQEEGEEDGGEYDAFEQQQGEEGEAEEDEHEDSEADEVLVIGNADGKGEGKKKDKKGGGAQVLPVADLPDDWEGDAEDGATYLALAMRADKVLPTFTRAENPWSSSAAPALPDIGEAAQPDQAAAGPSRHPALPKKSWQTVFPHHFVEYRRTIAQSWPPSPPLPYPSTWPKIPPTSQRGEWGYYINGYPRRKLSPPARPKTAASSPKGKGPAVEVDEEEGLNAEVDEEEGMNAGGGDEDDVDMDLEDEEEAALNYDTLEPLGERHKSRDPHVCILQKLDTFHIISVLTTLTTHIQNTLTPLESDLIPPSYDPLTSSSSSYRPHSRKNPFTEHYSRWIYALLLVLDPFLSAAQVSALRELARVVMRVGAWRWVEAVMAGEVGLPASSSNGGAAGEGGTGAAPAPVPWVMGARWKYARDSREAAGVTEAEMARPAKEQITPNQREEYDETGVDETLGRCWLIVHAISAGWGQKDLVMDLEEMFS